MDSIIKGLDIRKAVGKTVRVLEDGRVFIHEYPGGEDYWYGGRGKYFQYEVHKSSTDKG